MIKSIIAIKGEMGASFNQQGHRIPVTSLFADSNVVVDVGQNKITLGIGAKKKVKKTENAFVNKLGFVPKFIKEVSGEAQVKIGDKITVSVFSTGDLVKVTGISKGKGFAGGVKRWGFHGGPKTHGQSNRHRAPGSIGQTTTPGRVFKGKKMAGHLGNVQKTVRDLEVIVVDQAKNILVVKGSVPGFKKGYLIVEVTGRAKTHAPMPEPEKEVEKAEDQNIEKSDDSTNQQASISNTLLNPDLSDKSHSQIIINQVTPIAENKGESK